jgi:predicted nucleic acid-binding protein
VSPKVYLETSIISYLTARPSRDVVVAGHQQTTRDWWETQRPQFLTVASQLVVQEASAGDMDAAQQRLAVLTSIELLATSEEAIALARTLVQQGTVPTKAAADALHIAIAVTNGVEYLLTWNCRHIANASMRHRIEQLCRTQGYEPTIICTPDELWDS